MPRACRRSSTRSAIRCRCRRSTSRSAASASSPRAARRARLWIGITEGSDPLAALHAAFGARLVRAGVSVEPRPFTPHLTLARARPRDRRAAGARTAPDRPGGPRRLAGLDVLAGMPARWRVDRVALMNSDLSGPRPRYESIKIVWCQ